jgi:lysophospholipase L1-like esterase
MSYNKKIVLYSSGDSTVWGAELENKEKERFSSVISNELEWVDCNNASAGVSNDYIYRQTIRDVSHWLKYKKVWSEETDWVDTDSIFVLIGWTAPTRFEWWGGNEYKQERLWLDYDKWGYSDSDKMTDALFAINQTMDIPSYIRTFNHIISLSSFLELNKIPYYFFNTFYEYNIPNEPTQKIDKFGKKEYQTGLNVLWDILPNSVKDETMFSYIRRNGGDFLSRKHPSAKSHKLWADWLIKNVYKHEKR